MFNCDFAYILDQWMSLQLVFKLSRSYLHHPVSAVQVDNIARTARTGKPLTLILFSHMRVSAILLWTLADTDSSLIRSVRNKAPSSPMNASSPA